ncbi:MAG: response regulator transcription factor, partial [Candidatus Paceibacteria bacterium]
MAENKQTHILVVEDEKPISRVLKMKLEQKGYTVTIAHNGNKAIQVFREQSIDAILLDLILPEQNGFETLEQIRKENTEIPIVVLSNLGQPEDRERVEEYGITDYYVKANISLHQLVEELE